jgi:hypothetical protein
VVVLRRNPIGVSGVSGGSPKAVRRRGEWEASGSLSILRLTLTAGPAVMLVGLLVWFLVR